MLGQYLCLGERQCDTPLTAAIFHHIRARSSTADLIGPQPRRLVAAGQAAWGQSFRLPIHHQVVGTARVVPLLSALTWGVIATAFPGNPPVAYLAVVEVPLAVPSPLGVIVPVCCEFVTSAVQPRTSTGHLIDTGTLNVVIDLPGAPSI